MSDWHLIENAPMWAEDHEAILGQRNSEGRWVMLWVWDSAWSRDAYRYRGATHWMKLPAIPTPRDDDAERDFVAMIS